MSREQSNTKSFATLISSFILVANLFLIVHAQTSDTPTTTVSNNEGPYDCTRILLRAAKQTMKALRICSQIIKENSTNNQDYGNKLACIMKCAMEKINVLGPNSLLDDNSVKRMMEAYVPNKKMLNEVKAAVLDTCATVAARLDPKEETCKSYGEYTLCLQTAVETYKDNSPWCIKKQKKN